MMVMMIKIIIVITMIMCTQLHFNICKETGIKLDNKRWYDPIPKSV